MTLTIPTELKDADEQLHKYGSWAQDRFKKQHCASIEHKYHAPKQYEEEPMIPFIADFHAADIQRSLNLVPIIYRRVLHAHYIPQRMPKEAHRRMMRLSPKLWDEGHLMGLRMFFNNWRLHIAKAV